MLLQGKLNIINGSLDNSNPEIGAAINKIQQFPNGDYKLELKYHRDAVKGGSDGGDEKILGVTMFFEVFERGHHLNSYDSLK